MIWIKSLEGWFRYDNIYDENAHKQPEYHWPDCRLFIMVIKRKVLITYWSSAVTTDWPLEPQSLLGPEIFARATYQLLACSSTGSSNNMGYFSLTNKPNINVQLVMQNKIQFHVITLYVFFSSVKWTTFKYCSILKFYFTYVSHTFTKKRM